MTKVVITTAGHEITVEADDVDLDQAAAKALELWQATRDPQMARGYNTAGFVTERSGAQGGYTSGYDHQ
jgi:hypothetical protein